MNKTLIAAAVSAALMAPVAAQADVTVYGRIHNGIAISIQMQIPQLTSTALEAGSASRQALTSATA